jgi:DNA-binding transcriptional LysR family regulator
VRGGWDLGAEHAGLDVTPLMSDPMLAVLPAEHHLSAADSVRWSDLARSDWVLEPGDTLFTQRVTAHCRRAGFEPRVRARVRDFATQTALVSALGLVAVRPAMAAPATDAVATRPLSPDLRGRLMVVTRAAGHPSVADLTSALRQVADELTGSSAVDR